MTTHTHPSWQRPLQTLPVLLGLMLQAATATATLAKPTQAPQRFVVIPKVHHPWFDAVRKGAQAATVMIEAQTGGTASIDYRAPSHADPREQANILKAAIRSQPTGITIDLVDATALRPLLKKAQQQGIAVNVFDSEPPSDLPLTSIGNDFCQQARIASERLVKLLNGQGEVAIMQGVTTAPNHAIRVRCHQQVFARHPGITVVATPIDQDSITIAEQQALATMERHPQLRGWVVADAGGGIGVGRAIQNLNRTGDVKVVALDDLPEQLEQIQSGLVDSTAATKAHAQGYWAVVNLWQHHLGAPAIERIDTGIRVHMGGASP